MDSLDDSENNVKISDSAYSNSCSNSQSRRSHSLKSTHSGSNSSGSSGYGGKQSVSESTSLSLPQEKRSKEKDGKKKLTQAETVTAESIIEPETLGSAPTVHAQELQADRLNKDVMLAPPTPAAEQATDFMEIVEEKIEKPVSVPLKLAKQYLMADQVLSNNGFSCVISMLDGEVMYTTPSITSILGFPKEMWIGRSFIDFVHPEDRSTFGNEIVSGIATPKNVACSTFKATQLSTSIGKTMCCRIRTYRGLASGFSVKSQTVTYLPFSLTLSFKDISENEGIVFLIIQASLFVSAFKTPNEVVLSQTPFHSRYLPCGKFVYMGQESVPYLGYLPQEMTEKDALNQCHLDDLTYLLQIYKALSRNSSLPRSKPYRFMTQNGDFVKIETEFSCFVNPWSRRLEYICGKHYVVEGPAEPDVFKAPSPDKILKYSDEQKSRFQLLRERILVAISEISTKSLEVAKLQISKRCLELASVIENLVEESPKLTNEIKLEIQDHDITYERDSIMLGGISPHHENESKSSNETPLSYTMLSYKENLQRYFSSYQPCQREEFEKVTEPTEVSPPATKNTVRIAEGEEVATMEDQHLYFLSEGLLVKHNADMRIDLIKKYRERPKERRDKKEYKQNKKDHLARCNASYQPTQAEIPPHGESQTHGLKRPSWHCDPEVTSHKHHCYHQASPDRSKPMMYNGLQQLMPVISPVVPASMFPMYYVPGASPPVTINSNYIPTTTPSSNMFHQPAVPFMMYPPTMFGTPLMYSSMNAQVSTQFMQGWLNPNAQAANKPNSVKLRDTNLEEESGDSNNTMKRHQTIRKSRRDDTITSDKTDEGSSYSSFCSSFFNTESGMSLEESEGANNRKTTYQTLGPPTQQPYQAGPSSYFAYRNQKISKCKEPPWMQKVNVTPDLIYKYQMTTKHIDEVLEADRKKIISIEQPNLVNEQLSQLYIDLHLEGAPMQLTLEEGIVSSSCSSGEENLAGGLQPAKSASKMMRKKRQYSRLVMIYEEDAPLPPPE